MDLLLDTSVASIIMRRADTDLLRRKYESHLEHSDQYLSFQTVAELYETADRNRWGDRRRALLEQQLACFSIIHSTDELARRYSAVRTRCLQAGRRLEAPDGWIVATASLYNLVLVTHDRDFTGLPIEGVTVICYA